MKKRTGDPKQAIAYIRVSTDEQNLGPAAQRETIRNWAHANGVRILEYHFDEGFSGSLPATERPGLLAAIEAVDTFGAGLFLVAKRDRLARDRQIAPAIEREIEGRGALVMSMDGLSSGKGASGLLTRGLGDLLAEYERALIRERTTDALAVKKSRGERVGSIPFGYKLAADGIHLEVDVDELEVIGMVRAMREAGVAFRKIVNALELIGARPRGEKWHLKTVQRIADKREA